MTRPSSHPLHSSGPGEEQKWFFQCWQQWTALFGRCNWYDLNLIHLGGEFCPYTGRWEFRVELLGFGMEVTYVYDPSFNNEMGKLSDQIRAGIQAEHPGVEIKDPLGVLDELDKRQPGGSESG